MDALFASGVGFITLNFKPDDLYPTDLPQQHSAPLRCSAGVVLVWTTASTTAAAYLGQLRMYLTPNGPAADAELTDAFDKLAERARP